jgi:hypothetical protein
MACYDAFIITNQHRICKTKSLDASSDLLDLFLSMRLRAAGVRR